MGSYLSPDAGLNSSIFKVSRFRTQVFWRAIALFSISLNSNYGFYICDPDITLFEISDDVA
ncbi:MAG: hypothetical protein KME12_05495 [Trichocoleus desertorum ATA4-8-CV12]|nr:hypothetical protein [Trichocoleus desertorum ATA4-8-CV12]